MKREEHYAVVTNIEDPERKRRVRVSCSTLMNTDKELPFWIPVEHPAGMYWSPQKGDTVVLVMTARDGYGALFAPDLRVRAKLDNDKVPAPTEFTGEDKATYLGTFGFQTPGGHTILLNDADGAETIEIRWTNGTDTHTVVIEKDKMTVSLGGDTMEISNNGTSTEVKIGGGLQKVAIADLLETLYSAALVGIKAIFDTHGHMYVSPGGPVATQGPMIGLGPSPVPMPLPDWDGNINSDNLKVAT